MITKIIKCDRCGYQTECPEGYTPEILGNLWATVCIDGIPQKYLCQNCREDLMDWIHKG
jgi:hypothetical protein